MNVVKEEHVSQATKWALSSIGMSLINSLSV